MEFRINNLWNLKMWHSVGVECVMSPTYKIINSECNPQNSITPPNSHVCRGMSFFELMSYQSFFESDF